MKALLAKLSKLKEELAEITEDLDQYDSVYHPLYHTILDRYNEKLKEVQNLEYTVETMNKLHINIDHETT